MIHEAPIEKDTSVKDIVSNILQRLVGIVRSGNGCTRTAIVYLAGSDLEFMYV